MIFRRIKAADAEAMYEIEKSSFSKPWSKQSFQDAALAKDMLFVAAEYEGKLVGYCGMRHVLDEGEITNVVVLSTYRKQGIGEKMLVYFLTEVKKLGIQSLVLEVRVSNRNAIKLYEKLGFRIVGRRNDLYECPVEDGYIMTLYQQFPLSMEV